MYSITVVNSTGEYTMFNTYDDDYKVVDPVLSLEINKSGTLTFSIASTHPNRDQIFPLASEIYVYDDSTVFWIGRPLTVETDFDLMATVTCEGVLGYLLDTQVPPFDFMEGNSIKGADCVKTFLQRLITSHNSRLSSNWVDARKKFVLGNVTVIDSNANLARSSEDYHSTLETINEKLISTHGGYLRVRVSGSTRYIDYLETLGAASQPITFGDNLLDLNASVDTASIATVVIPVGAEIEDTGKRIDLLNYTPNTATATQIRNKTHGGAKYNTGASGSFANVGAIYDAAGVNRHGRVYVEQVWDDVTTQQNLALKAADYIGTVSVLGEVLDVSAVDLSRIDVEYKRFNVGEMANVISIPHNVNAEYQITQMSINLFNPAGSTMTLGGERRTYTFENTKQTIEFSEKMSEQISSAVQNATALLSGGLGGYLFIKRDSNDQPYEILIMNAATESAATRSVIMNQNGIGFGQSAVGSTNWTYRNAWTIDGNLLADFITTGTLKSAAVISGTSTPITKFNLNTGELNVNKGNINLGGGNCTITDAGVLTMKKGSISIGGAFSVNTAGALTCSNATITGGSLKIGKNFEVDSSGDLTASNAYITGTINASVGTIGGWTISKTGLSTGTSGSSSYASLSSSSGITLGKSFSVTKAGKLTAKSGEIGPWSILSSGLSYAGDNYESYIKKDSICFGKTNNTSALLTAEAGFFMLQTGKGSGYKLIAQSSSSGVYYGIHVESPSGAGLHAAGSNVRVSGGTATLEADRGDGLVSATSSGLTITTGRQTSSHSGNLYITTSGIAYYANEGGSSRKIKHDIGAIETPELDPSKLYDLDVVQFKYNDDIAPKGDENYNRDLPGFIVEDLEKIYPAAVQKEPDNPTESRNWTWSPIRLIPPMLKLIQDQHKEIEELKRRLP